MTNCFPSIITNRLCPRDELQFSNTPPTCVRVVPIYNDSVYVISQFPPPVHFLVTDDGTVYHLAPIQSPPSTPPEYHAVLDSSGCILVGVEFSSVTNSPITTAQIEVLPGVLRYVLTTLSLPLTSVTSTIPTPRCRRQLWNEILTATTDCLNEPPPPPPPPPPSLSCAFVLGCLSAGQNINITAGGNIRAGQLVQGPNPGEYTWVTPSGTPSFTFSPGGSVAVADTQTVNMSLAAGPTISADVIVSPLVGNQLQVTALGLYVPPTALNVNDTFTVDLSLIGGVLTADVIVSPVAGNQLQVTPQGLYVPPGTFTPCLSFAPALSTMPANGPLTIYSLFTSCIEQINLNTEAVVYGHHSGTGYPHNENLFFNPVRNVLWVLDNTTTLTPNFQNSFLLAHSNSTVSGPSSQFLGVVGQSNVVNTTRSLVNVTVGDIQFIESCILLARETSFLGMVNSLVISQNSNVRDVYDSLFVTSQSNIPNAQGSVGVVFASTVLSISRSFVNIIGETITPRITESVYIGRENSILPTFDVLRSIVTAYTNVVEDSVTIRSCFSALDNTRLVRNSDFNFSVLIADSSDLRQISRSIVSVEQVKQEPALVNTLFLNNRTLPVLSRIGPANPFIGYSVIINVNEIPISRLGFLVANQSVPFREFNQSIFAAFDFSFQDPNPPNNVVDVYNSIIVGLNLSFDLASTTVSDKLVVGSEIRVGTDTRLAVGRGVVATASQLLAGGFTMAVGDGIGSNFFEAWGNGVWRYRDSGSFANDAAAIAALNTVYGADPRISPGSFVSAFVAGTPALFAWDGTTFVRITV